MLCVSLLVSYLTLLLGSDSSVRSSLLLLLCCSSDTQVGHRGLGIPGLHVPENSLPAFMGARELGAHAVECDVMLTADGSVAVFHDVSLHRCLEGVGDVSGLTQQELEKLEYRYPPLTVAESAKLNESFRLNPLREGEDLEAYLSRVSLDLSEAAAGSSLSPGGSAVVVKKAEPEAAASGGGRAGVKQLTLPIEEPKKLLQHSRAILEGKGTLLLAEILTGASFRWDPEDPLGPDLSALRTVVEADGETLVHISESPSSGALSPRTVLDMAAQVTAAAVTATMDDYRFDVNHDHNHPEHAPHPATVAPPADLSVTGPTNQQEMSAQEGDTIGSPEEVKKDPEQQIRQKSDRFSSYDTFEKLAAAKAAEICEASMISVEERELEHLHTLARTSQKLRQIRFRLPTDILENWTRVPTLQRMLRLCWRLDLRVIIEIKEISRVRKMVECLGEILDEWDAECLAESGASLQDTPPEHRPSVTHILVASFDPRSLYLLRKQRPLVPICLLYCAALGDWIMNDNSEGVKVPPILRKLRFLVTVADWILEYGAPYLVAPFLQADMVSAHSVLISPQLVAFNKRRGRVTGAWTVNSYLDRDYLLSLGVCVTTDRCFYPQDILG